MISDRTRNGLAIAQSNLQDVLRWNERTQALNLTMRKHIVFAEQYVNDAILAIDKEWDVRAK